MPSPAMSGAVPLPPGLAPLSAARPYPADPDPQLILGGTPFRRGTALADGMSPTRLQQLTSDGLLRRLHREVLVDARVPDTVKLRAQALSLVLPEGAAVARQTAAWLYGVDARAPGQHLDLPEIVCVVPLRVMTHE